MNHLFSAMEPESPPSNFDISLCKFNCRNTECIDLLEKRGDSIRNGNLSKADKCFEQIENWISQTSKMHNFSKPSLAFVTFTNIKSA
jgi:hypothetical protein